MNLISLLYDTTIDTIVKDYYFIPIRNNEINKKYSQFNLGIIDFFVNQMSLPNVLYTENQYMEIAN
jgi:hypothetical protein